MKISLRKPEVFASAVVAAIIGGFACLAVSGHEAVGAVDVSASIETPVESSIELQMPAGLSPERYADLLEGLEGRDRVFGVYTYLNLHPARITEEAVSRRGEINMGWIKEVNAHDLSAVIEAHGISGEMYSVVADKATQVTPPYVRPVSYLATPSHSLWTYAAKVFNVTPSVLYAISLQESGVKADSGKQIPWPWTLNMNCKSPCPGGPKRFVSYKEAKAYLTEALRKGWTNVDIGMMQVNYKYHGEKFKGVDLLLPQANVLAAASILREYIDASGGREARGIERYHNGNPEIGGPYRKKVMKWKSIVEKREGIL